MVLTELGLTILRFTNEEILNNTAVVLNQIKKAVG
jgi:very-short-patch-repair endonuclease